MIIDDEEQDQMSVEELKDFIHSDEFKGSIEKASESRLEIINDFTPEMKDIKKEFVEYMTLGSGASSKDEKKEAKRKFNKTFKKVVDYVHYQGGWPKPDTKAKLETLAENVEVAIKYLDFMQCSLFRDRLTEHGIYIDDSKTRKLTDDCPDIKPETWENLKGMIEDGSQCQGKICQSADNIKINIFENEVPAELQYSKDNPGGLKKGAFNKLVTAKAMATKKTEEKYKKYLDNLTENSIFNVAREELIQEGVENIKED